MFHIAPYCTPEQHRRLIGNDILVVIFHDDPDYEPFDPTVLADLGTVPQIFCVVQSFNNLYRLGFLHRKNIKDFGPPSPPIDYCFDKYNVFDYLFTKLHNGLKMSKLCPPMNRLYSTPRAETLKTLGEKFPKSDSKKPGGRSGRTQTLIVGTTNPKTEEKVMIVKVVKAKDLTVCDKNGLSDPYVILNFGDLKFKTSVVRKNLSPEWNAVFKIDINLQTDQLTDFEFTVMDWDRMKQHDYMGEFRISLKDIIDHSKLGKLLELELYGRTNEKVNGAIYVEFELEGNNLH